jgi:phosphohistidine phosphatase
MLLRHSKSDWSGDEADIDRPLAKRGRRQAPESGRWLATHVDRIDMAVVSTAERTRATWDLVSAEFGERPSTRHDEDAYVASAVGLLDIIRVSARSSRRSFLSAITLSSRASPRGLSATGFPCRPRRSR